MILVDSPGARSRKPPIIPSQNATQTRANAHDDDRMRPRQLSDVNSNLEEIGLGSRRCYAVLCPVFATLLLAFSGSARAAIINAASPSFTDVAAAVNSAADGDTVVIPAGTATWTTGLVVRKGITIQGATTVDTSSSPGSATDNTILIDHIPRTGTTNWGTFFTAVLTSTQSFDLTGITFQGDSNLNLGNANASVELDGTCPSARIDHCHFVGPQSDYITVTGQIFGVIDHCLFDIRNFGCDASIRIFHDGWNGAQFGDGSWADSPYWGSNKFIFIEDNIFNNSYQIQTVGDIDTWNGGRYVARHNIFNGTLPNSHGTDSSGRARSARAIEIYNNTFNFTYSAVMGSLRGGTILVHDNTYGSNANIIGGITLACYREYNTFSPWNGAFGTNGWDSNDAHGVYDSGTVTANSVATGSTAVFTDSTKSWTTNQWAGYSLLKAATGRGSFIISNTATTITYSYDTSYDSNGNLAFTSGDSYSIYKVLIALDQTGRGKGDLLGNDGSGNPINTTTGTVAWPHQALEPCYSWNNKRPNGSLVNFDVGSLTTILANREYYNENDSFDGTSGVGMGTVANQPSTCTTGVAYWATDQNTLYQCSATDTWTPYYMPYTYPHPLVTSGGHGPQAPGDLHIMP